MNKELLVNMLAGVRFLQGLSREHLDLIASIAELRDYGTSETVFREGEKADSAYLVVSGKLSLELSPSTIYRKHLVDVGPGEMLGWSSLTDSQRFAATAVTVEPTRLVRIDGTRLRAFCDADPQFGYEIVRRAMKSLAKRLTATWTQLSHLYVSQFAPMTAPSDE
jgi:CRP-like cAMP-binding protein